MAYTTALAQWAGPQCSHTVARTGRPAPQTLCRTGLFHSQRSICRLAQLKQRLPHATGTQVRDEDLASEGNQAAFQDMHEEKVLDTVNADSIASDVVQKEREQKPPPRVTAITARGRRVTEATDAEIQELFQLYGADSDGEGDDEVAPEGEIDDIIDELERYEEEIIDEMEEEEVEDDEGLTGNTEEVAAEEGVDIGSGQDAGKTLPGPARFSLNFLWLEKNVAVSVDQIFGEDKKSPVTEYFFWPRQDAWEELKTALEKKTWVQERDKILLLNQATQVINYWQDSEVKPSLDEARGQFPDVMFQGSN